MKNLEEVKTEIKETMESFNSRKKELGAEVAEVIRILESIRSKTGQRQFYSETYWIELGVEFSDMPEAGTIENGTENPGTGIFTEEFKAREMKEFMQNAPVILQNARTVLEEELNCISD